MTHSHLPQLFLAVCLCAPLSALAHHTYTEYDNQKTIEIEGRIVKAAWMNPHAHIQVETTDKDHNVVVYDVESSPLNYFRRVKVPVEMYAAGTTVKIAGWPSKRSPTRLYGTNILSADGKEAVLWQSRPRWGKTAYGYSVQPYAQPSPVRAPGTMFHVWSSIYDDPDAGPRALGRTKLPLTPAAQRAMTAFNPVTDSTTPGCTPKGMPTIMSIPTPMELVEKKDVILLRMEEYDTVRTIHMTGAGNADAQPRTPVGYSTGRREGKTLVVDTSRINARYFNGQGVPLGGATRLVERFTLGEDGKRLHYTLTVMDPEIFTAPVEMKRSWVYRPGDKVLPFNCTTD